MGPAEGNAHRIWNPNTQAIVVSTNVVFDERNLGFPEEYVNIPLYPSASSNSYRPLAPPLRTVSRITENNDEVEELEKETTNKTEDKGKEKVTKDTDSDDEASSEIDSEADETAKDTNQDLTIVSPPTSPNINESTILPESPPSSPIRTADNRSEEHEESDDTSTTTNANIPIRVSTRANKGIQNPGKYSPSIESNRQVAMRLGGSYVPSNDAIHKKRRERCRDDDDDDLSFRDLDDDSDDDHNTRTEQPSQAYTTTTSRSPTTTTSSSQDKTASSTHINHLTMNTPGPPPTPIEPQSYAEALRCPERDKWKQAMQEEINALMKNRTWFLVKRPHDANVVKGRWVYKIKLNADGSVDRYKARWVARGYSQIEGVDFDVIFAPVATSNALRLFLVISASEDFELHKMDVKGAYLHADIDVDVYVEQPTGFRYEGKHRVCKLAKGLYGLKQAGRLWYLTIDTFLKQQGFVSLPMEPCIYVKHDRGKMIMILLYVDDLLIACHASVLQATKHMFMKKFEMVDLGEATSMLACEILRDRANRTIYIRQRGYLQGLVSQFRQQDSNPTYIPMDPGIKLDKLETTPRDCEHLPYSNLVGGLMYAACWSRPDINFAVNYISRFQIAHDNTHWNAAIRILRYVNTTKDLWLKLGGSPIKGKLLNPLHYSDSDWGGDKNDMHSTSAIIALLNGPIAWTVQKQKRTALSSGEAEYVAMSEAAKLAIKNRQIITSLGYHESGPSIVITDSSAAEATAKSDTISSQMKHVRIRHHFIRDAILDREITVQRCDTTTQIADLLTKPLARTTFERLRTLAGIVPFKG
jgi:hypothetical protein